MRFFIVVFRCSGKIFSDVIDMTGKIPNFVNGLIVFVISVSHPFKSVYHQINFFDGEMRNMPGGG